MSRKTETARRRTALTLGEVIDSPALAYLAVALVLLGAIALVLGIAYTAIVLLRRPEFEPSCTAD